jgi:hypothetical protein
MEPAELTKGSGHELPIWTLAIAGLAGSDGRGAVGRKAVRKKAAARKGKPARLLRKEMGSKSKSDKLICRYCGSDDLALSFIKRRDRRCRQCFMDQRHGRGRQRSRK